MTRTLSPSPQKSQSNISGSADESHSILACAKQVIEQEIVGLQHVIDSLGEAFVKSVDILSNLKGRVIVTGMGKSGHVGNKIAATLASTGTPAFFVHPGEASHGDLGMITKDDVVLALSNSGETAELQDIIYYCKRFQIPLIAMVRRKSSMLVEAATAALVLPDVPEASPVNAPTTSTTMMMALGDAIAVALLKKKGFSKEDFGLLHPGGKLGKSFIKIESLMHKERELPMVNQDAKMSEVLIEMTAKGLGCAGVIDKSGALIGMITDGDLRRHMQSDLLNLPAALVMTKNPLTISPSALAIEVLGILNAKQITNIFVVDKNQKPVGIIHIHDLLRAGVA